jgi:hypothetical protein
LLTQSTVMRLRSLLPGLALLLILSSCSKDFDAGSTAWSGPKLSRILVNGVVSSDFEYDNKGRLIRYTDYQTSSFTGLKISETKKYYDNQGRLIKTEGAFNISSSTMREQMDSGYSDMSYDANNRLIETKNYRIARAVATYASKAIPDYDAEGRTIAITLYEAVTNRVYAKYTYQYNALGNIITDEFFQYNAGIPGPSFRSVYEHDNKQNPYQNIWGLPFGANVNNITKQVVTNYIAVPANPSTTTNLSVFKNYNGDGYPTLVSENGVDYVYEYK